MRPQISARSLQFLEEASDLMDQKNANHLGNGCSLHAINGWVELGFRCLSQNGWIFQRLFQHTPRAHPRQSPKPIMKEIPL